MAIQPFTATKRKDNSVFVHATSPNGDVTSYYAYVPKTKTRYSPFSDSSGYSGYESTHQSGKTIQFTGMFYMTGGVSVPIRDTYTMLGMNKQYDVSESKVAGNVTFSRSKTIGVVCALYWYSFC